MIWASVIEYLPYFSLLLIFLGYPLLVRGGLTLLPQVPRNRVLTVANLVGLLVLSFLALAVDGLANLATDYFRLAVVCTFIYFAVAVIHWKILTCWGDRGGWRTLVSFLFPLAILILIKYSPFAGNLLHRTSGGAKAGVEVFVGISYTAFRLSYLTLEIRNETLSKPSLWDYLAYAFFLPTLSVGPINTYGTHSGPRTTAATPAGFLLRVLVGAVKYLFLASLFNQLSYTGLLMDGYPHHWVDLVVASISYYFYLYLNFSGFCDMAIGISGFLGIKVPENFDNPFAARNIKDFWNRWHITLSIYVRDVVFSPLSKWLVRLFGGKGANHAIAISILVVFLVIGVWHGASWHYLLFGLSHGVAVVVNHYYTLFLKKRLGRERFKAYQQNPVITAAAVGMTFMYVSASLFLFANNFTAMQRIFSVLR